MDFGSRFVNLSKNLDKSEQVKAFDDKSEKEAATLAHAILDMEESFKSIITKIPELESPLATEEGINETLMDIQTKLEHVVYHIYDTKFYRHLIENINPDDHKG